MITNRPHRLRGVSYVGFQRYFVTTCTAFRRPLFADTAVGRDVAATFCRVARASGFAVVAYCVMPDHLHLLPVAQAEDADLERFVKLAKQITAFAYKRSHNRSPWQPGYHERILRDDEAALAVAKYILANPVRARMASCLGEWPLAGSDVYTWPELLTAWEHADHAGNVEPTEQA